MKTRINGAGVFVHNDLTLQIDGWDVAILSFVDNDTPNPEDGEPPVLSVEEHQAVIDAVCKGLGIDDRGRPLALFPAAIAALGEAVDRVREAYLDLDPNLDAADEPRMFRALALANEAALIVHQVMARRGKEA